MKVIEDQNPTRSIACEQQINTSKIPTLQYLNSY